MKIYPIIVIYNLSIKNSETCKRLLKLSNKNIFPIVVDNSTKNFYNKDDCDALGWKYINMGGNAGLSKAYNIAVQSIHHDIMDYFVLLDDDSCVTQKYFDSLEYYIYKTNADILVPAIKGQDGKFYSPNETRFFKNKQIKNEYQMINKKKFNAINSCTCIRSTIFDSYFYDEKLFLDQVDHKFFEDMREKKVHFCQMPIIIEHNFSLKEQKKDYEFLVFRYTILIKDYLTFVSSKRIKLLLGKIKVIFWGIKESIKIKNIKFLFFCIKSIIKWNKKSTKSIIMKYFE